MLGRKDLTQQELDGARTNVEARLRLFRTLAKVAADGKAQRVLQPSSRGSPTTWFSRSTGPSCTGSGWSPDETRAPNVVELIAESLMHRGGVFTTNNVIKYIPDASVLGLKDGDRIRLSADDFQRLSTAFFADLERKFVAKG
jgi:hypothetical protein